MDVGADTPEIEKGQLDPQPSRRDQMGLVKRFPFLISHLPLYSWQWSLMPMTTLGLSTLLHAQISLHSFHGLYTIGLVIYFIGLVQYVLLLLGKCARFFLIKHSLRNSLLDPEEALFFAAFWISTYGVITGAIDFAAPAPGTRLSYCFIAFFWIYMICAVCQGLGLYLLVCQKGQLEGAHATPLWLLPVLPVILVGVMAGSFVGSASESDIYSILLAGLLCAGLGFLFSLPFAAIYLLRMLTAGLPDSSHRPGMMVAVGPPTYAPLAFMKIVKGIPSSYGFFATHPLANQILETMALFMSIPIFGMGLAFFFMALGPILKRIRSMKFHLTWYSFVFPNVGLFSTMGLLGLYIPSEGVTWVATAGTILLSAVWLYVSACHILAIVRRSEYLW